MFSVKTDAVVRAVCDRLHHMTYPVKIEWPNTSSFNRIQFVFKYNLIVLLCKFLEQRDLIAELFIWSLEGNVEYLQKVKSNHWKLLFKIVNILQYFKAFVSLRILQIVNCVLYVFLSLYKDDPAFPVGQLWENTPLRLPPFLGSA